MPKITGGIPIHKLYNPKDRRTNFHNFTWQYLHRTARNLASAVAAVHAKGYVIGDLNESNILVQPTALVTLVDTDSFQVRHPNGQVFRCPVGKPDYIAPELQGKQLSLVNRTPEQDRFALAVLIFLLLMEGSHPFRGANPPEIGNRIRQGLFPNLTRFTLHPDVLHPEVWQNFERCFIQGHQNPYARPEATDWLGALDNAENELVVCPKNQHHSYIGTQARCTWCERKNLLKNDPFPISPSGQPAISSQKPLPSIRKTSVAPPIQTKPVPPPRPSTPHLQPKASNISKPVLTNSLGMKFVYILPGTFMMGSPSSEHGRKDDEKLHKVTLTKGFYMQTTQVTQGQWKAVMGKGNNPSYFKNCGDDCPVEGVSWDDAVRFINRLNQKEGMNRYRLPTEAEWEYACRAGSSAAHSLGNDIGQLGSYAWYQGNSGRKTQPVGFLAPNDWELYDMHGNVWEWCADWRGDYPSGDVTDPAGSNSGSLRVFRGGCWDSDAQSCQAARRNSGLPDNRVCYVGFRLVRNP